MEIYLADVLINSRGLGFKIYPGLIQVAFPLPSVLSVHWRVTLKFLLSVITSLPEYREQSILEQPRQTNQRLVKLKDHEKRNKTQNDRGGKSTLSSSCKPSAGAEKQFFS